MCEIVAEAIEAIVEPIIFAEAADLIDWHHEQGRLVVIVSASPDEIVTPLSRFLGADDCIASKARVDDNGRYTGTMQFYAFGPFKAEAMDVLAAERGIDLAASYAYTDSYTDLPMLEAVGHPVAVNPDRVLNRYRGSTTSKSSISARPSASGAGSGTGSGPCRRARDRSFGRGRRPRCWGRGCRLVVGLT